MATQTEIAFTYDWMDGLFRLSLGEMADLSGAYYGGDYSKTLEQAQRDKHRWILDGLVFQPGYRVLDVGCGWGNMMNSIRESGGYSLGLTLSPAQAASCRRNKLDVILKDWKSIPPEELGRFDAVISIGSFEHFCSIDEYVSGQQERIYRDFFKFSASCLRPHGRLYLQTMTWGKKVPDPYMDVNLHAAEGTEEKILARLKKFYPGSWLPVGKEQIIEEARSHFKLIDANNGRCDYIQTLLEWRKAGNRCFKYCIKNPSKWHIIAKLGQYFLKDQDFFHKIVSYCRSDQRVVFEKLVFDHFRMLFEKK